MLLELDDYEALALYHILRKVSGSSTSSIRKYAESVKDKLRPVVPNVTRTTDFIGVSSIRTLDNTLYEFNTQVDDWKNPKLKTGVDDWKNPKLKTGVDDWKLKTSFDPITLCITIEHLQEFRHMYACWNYGETERRDWYRQDVGEAPADEEMFTNFEEGIFDMLYKIRRERGL